jgi:ANTAR domain-containing protein
MGALMERERLDDQEAFTHLRRAARSSGRKLTEVAAEVAAGQHLPRWRTRPAPVKPEQPDAGAVRSGHLRRGGGRGRPPAAAARSA